MRADCDAHIRLYSNIYKTTEHAITEAKESKKTITKRESEKMKNVPELDEPL